MKKYRVKTHNLHEKLHRLVLAVRKEPVAVAPDLDEYKYPFCPNCGKEIHRPWNFCPCCGQAINWENVKETRNVDNESLIRNLIEVRKYLDIKENEDEPVSSYIYTIYNTISMLSRHQETVESLKKRIAGNLAVVRCKDCAYYEMDYYCKKHSKHVFNMEWFCADGERREEE